MRLIPAIAMLCLISVSAVAAGPQDPVAARDQLDDTLRKTQAEVDRLQQSGEVPDYLRREVPAEYLQEASKQLARSKLIERNAIREQALGNGVSKSELSGTPLGDDHPVNPDAGRIAVFISSSMPVSMIREVLAGAARDNVSVMIRGLIPGTKNFLETQVKLAEWSKDIDPRPDIILNPLAFSNHKVKVVPTVIFAGRNQGQEDLRVEGNFNLEFLEKKLKAGKGKPVVLGRVGQVFDVVEQDMIAAMQQRFESIDWEAKAKAAREHFWTKYKFVDLPPARENLLRKIDPTVVVTEDVKNPRDETQFIARAGERHNPLEKVPLTRRIIVFDARDPKQLAIVRDLRKRPLPNKMDVYITTGIDRDRGWDQHTEISQEFASPLYVLNSDLKTMFRLRAIPSVITADGTHLVIQEIKVPL